MEFFKFRSQINFMAERRKAAIVSTLLFTLSIIILAYYQLHLGMDFTGGTQIHLRFQKIVPQKIVYQHFNRAGIHNASIINYGTAKEMLISFAADHLAGDEASTHPAPISSDHTKDSKERNITRDQIQQILYGLPDFQIEQMNYIGPQVGEEMIAKGMMAIIVALLGTMCYIALRFDLRLAIGAMIALIHDPIIILGVFSYFQLEFNLIALAAILTVIGYSLNDTIVIYDRLREHLREKTATSTLLIMDQAINQTLSRTVMTSALTLIVVLALLCLGGPVLHSFSIALAVGIIVGTYSSIYVAGSFALALGLKREHLFASSSHTPSSSI